MKKPRPIRASYFVWIVALAALYGAYATFGLPHVIWSYSFQLVGTNDRWDHARCVFIGAYGQFITYPNNGQCPWVVFRRAQDAGADQ